MVTRSTFNNLWERVGDTRPGGWAQNQWDSRTRGDRYFRVSDWGDPYIDGQGQTPEGFNFLYENDPENWWRRVMADNGVNAYGPFGSWAMKNIIPGLEQTSWLFQQAGGAGTDGQQPGDVAGFGQDYMNWFMGRDSNFAMDYGTIGEGLQEAISGNDSVFSKMLVENSGNPEAQRDLIGGVIQTMSMGTMSRGQRAIVLGELQYQYDQYAQGLGSNPNQEFWQYLVENQTEFLDYYWSKERWTAMDGRSASGWDTASRNGGGSGGNF